MRAGVPKDIKVWEKRVACTPTSAKAYKDHGHGAYVEAGAGEGAGFSDDDYVAAGATILERAHDV